MINLMARKITLPSIFFLLLFLTSLSSQEDYRSRIAIIPMENGTGMDQYNPLCNTITETVSLVLEFLKDYRVLDEEDADLSRLENLTDPDELGKVAGEEGIDEVIFGRALVEDGIFQFTLSLFNVNQGEVTNSQSVEAYSVLEVFDAADELTEGLIGQLSDVHIAFGSINLKQIGGKGNYTVNLDGFPLRNPDKTFLKVLNGQYEIAITQERLTGLETVFRESVDVVEDEKTVVEFSLPPGLTKEFEWMEEQGGALLVLGEDAENIDSFLEGITQFQNRTLALEYDPELESLRDNYLDLAGARATEILQSRMDEADANFYSKRPRFGSTLNNYEEISNLVDTRFDIKMLASSDDLAITEPQKVQVNENGTVYFDCFDKDGRSILVGWNPENDGLVSRKLTGQSGDGYFSGDFIVSGRRLYLWEAGNADVEILDSSLKTSQILPIPDLPVGPENLKLAVSSKGLVYVLSQRIVRVVDTSRQYDDDGHLLPPDRYTGIEQKLEEVIQRNSGDPGDVFFDKARHLNLFFPALSKLVILDENGSFLKELSFSLCSSRSRIAVDVSGYIYLSLYDDNSVAKYTPSGEMITTYGSYGTEEGQFSLTTGIAVDEGGILFIADSYNARIQGMDPLTPPVLYPEIAQYSGDLGRRIERTEVAVKKEKIARSEITWGDHFWNILGSGVFLAATGLMAVEADIVGAEAAYSYEWYNQSTDPDTISGYRENAEDKRNVQALMEIGSMATLGISASFLTTTLLEIGLDSTLTRYSRRQAQRLDMNAVYETDPEKFRSVRTSYAIGVATGVMPPIIGLLSTVGLAASSAEVDKELIVGLTAMGVGLPPIFSHLHGGRFSMGLFLSGVVADLLAAGAIMNLDSLMDFDPWDAEKYYSYEDSDAQADILLGSTDSSFILERMLDRVGDLSPLYLMMAAYGVRLTAGIFDAKNGWTYTNNYNRYNAVEKIEKEEVSRMDWGVSPFLDRRGDLGLALNLSY